MGAYKLFSLIKNKVVIIRDVEFDESKGWNFINSMHEGKGSSHIRTTIQDDEQVVEVETKPAQPQEVRRSTRSKTQSVRLNDYEKFPDQAMRENGDLIEEAIG